jgi:hypothetical protein
MKWFTQIDVPSMKPYKGAGDDAVSTAPRVPSPSEVAYTLQLDIGIYYDEFYLLRHFQYLKLRDSPLDYERHQFPLSPSLQTRGTCGLRPGNTNTPQFSLPSNKVVDIIINNNGFEWHFLHFHGLHFHVIANGFQSEEMSLEQCFANIVPWLHTRSD